MALSLFVAWPAEDGAGRGAAPRPRARARRTAGRPRAPAGERADRCRQARRRPAPCMALLADAARQLEIAPGLEASLAIDPRAITAPQLADWRAAGIDRLVVRAGRARRGGPGRAGDGCSRVPQMSRSISPSRARARPCGLAGRARSRAAAGRRAHLARGACRGAGRPLRSRRGALPARDRSSRRRRPAALRDRPLRAPGPRVAPAAARRHRRRLSGHRARVRSAGHGRWGVPRV